MMMNIDISGNALQLLEDFIDYGMTYPDRLADAMWYDVDWFECCVHYLDKATRAAAANTGQQKTGQRIKEQPTLPEGFDHRFPEPIRGMIKEWLTYKAERKDFYSPTGLHNLLAQIDNRTNTHSAESIADLISECMANNWKGIIWERLGRQDTRVNGSHNVRRSSREPSPECLWSDILRAEYNEDA